MPRHDPVPVRTAPAAPDAIRNRHAWARYRRVMRWMTALALACVAVALGWLRWAVGRLPLHMAIATTAGVFLTVMVGTGLMSLAFLSAGSGHDAEAGERFDPHRGS
jgi:hypothetical protein